MLCSVTSSPFLRKHTFSPGILRLNCHIPLLSRRKTWPSPATTRHSLRKTTFSPETLRLNTSFFLLSRRKTMLCSVTSSPSLRKNTFSPGILRLNRHIHLLSRRKNRTAPTSSNVLLHHPTVPSFFPIYNMFKKWHFLQKFHKKSEKFFIFFANSVV